MEFARLSQRYKNFSVRECKGSSRLYEYLSLNIAEDDELLELSSHLTAEIRKGNTPLLLRNSPPVASKVGIDIHVNDLSNNNDLLC